MPTTWNPERWTDEGYNEAGDRVYSRAEGSGGSGAAVTSSSQMTKAALQDLAASRGLPTSGSKADLIDRLSGNERS